MMGNSERNKFHEVHLASTDQEEIILSDLFSIYEKIGNMFPQHSFRYIFSNKEMSCRYSLFQSIRNLDRRMSALYQVQYLTGVSCLPTRYSPNDFPCPREMIN